MRPLLHPPDFKWLDISLPQGVIACNPGVCRHNGALHMMATYSKEGEKLADYGAGFYKAGALYCVLKSAYGSNKLTFDALPLDETTGAAPALRGFWDLRLFEYDKRLYCNCCAGPLPPRSDCDTMQMLSVYDGATRKFTLPRRVVGHGIAHKRVEKNWAYFAGHSELYMIYSVIPWQVYKAVPDARPFEFSPLVIDSRDIGVPRAEYSPRSHGVPASPSVNPIEWNAQRLLFFVHTFAGRWPHRTYRHYALLIDKQTLLPCAVCERPVLTEPGMQGIYPEPIYINSIIDAGECIDVFAGHGDGVSSWAMIDKNEFVWKNL